MGAGVSAGAGCSVGFLWGVVPCRRLFAAAAAPVLPCMRRQLTLMHAPVAAALGVLRHIIPATQVRRSGSFFFFFTPHKASPPIQFN